MTSAAPKDFNKTRAVFMQNISGANIPPLAFKLSYLLVYRYANHKTQLCYPSQTTLAADLGVSIRTIQRLLDILERHGLVIAPGGTGSIPKG
jgi:DNA-binding MarR family transcriptional regulator